MDGSATTGPCEAMQHVIDEIDSSDRQLGSGYISGMLSIVLAVIGLGTVLCLMYPQYLTVSNARTFYNVPLIRLALQLVLIAAFVAGCLSATLRRNKLLGFIGMTIVLAASLLGGSQASRQSENSSDVYFGL